MPEFVFDPLDEPDLYNADSLNSRFRTGGTSAEEAVNDLLSNAPAPGALNNAHVPTMVHFSGFLNIGSAAATHTYVHAAGDCNNDNSPPDWAPIDSNGTTGGGTPLEVDLGTNYLLNSAVICQGVLVMADITLKRHYDPNGGSPSFYDYNHEAVFMIQVWDGAAWRNIERSVRWTMQGVVNGSATDTAEREQNFKIPIRTLIIAADIANNTIRKVRVVISIGNGNSSNTETVELEACQLSAIVLQSKRV